MKRIALIVDSHLGSTLPLCKEFAKKNCIIHYYIICVGKIKNPEGADIDYSNKVPGIHRIPNSCYPKLNAYLNSDKILIFAIVVPRPYTKIPFIHNIQHIYRRVVMKNVANKIKSMNYDAINLVGRHNTEEFIPIIEKNKTKSFVSLHEVGDHMKLNFSETPRLLNFLFINNIDIVVHSEKTKIDILQYSNTNASKIHHINFGLFSSFEIFQDSNSLKLPDKYFLFIGKITKYKGIQNFISAATEYSKRHQDMIKFVIAGSGYDECLEKIKGNEKFIVYNKYLSNIEFVEFIKKSYCVVCPYITMSQSGIPQTAYVYNKPIIASDLDGFREVIEDSVNGLLYKSQDIESLIQKMELSLDNDLYSKLCEKIQKFETFYPNYSWDFISEQYIKLFKQSCLFQ